MNIGKVSIRVKRKNNAQKKSLKALPEWDAAIADAKKKISDLEFSIEVFQRAKREGRLWPGSDGLPGYRILAAHRNTPHRGRKSVTKLRKNREQAEPIPGF